MAQGHDFQTSEETMAELGSLKEELERLRVERRVIADRMVASTRLTALGQLAAGVAHELNNPLSVILGFAQCLIHQFKTPESLSSSLQTIEQESQRCKRLIHDLLNFSRLPKPGKVLEDISRVLQGALSLVEAQAHIRNVELIRTSDDGLPMIYLDRHRVQQMLINLCTNAIDAMPQGGRLMVRVALAISERPQPSHIEICVSDTGSGIPEDIRERIFEPFYTTKEPGKGTGLGLSLVRDIVKEHEGRLEVLSEIGQGTTFTIRFPIVNQDVRHPGERVEEHALTPGLRRGEEP